jgi:hypothetical protein
MKETWKGLGSVWYGRDKAGFGADAGVGNLLTVQIGVRSGTLVKAEMETISRWWEIDGKFVVRYADAIHASNAIIISFSPPTFYLMPEIPKLSSESATTLATSHEMRS